MNRQASMTQSVSRSLKQLPGINALIRTTWWKRFRHRLTLALSQRRNCHFTCFLRLPTQFEALSGPVVDYLTRDGGVQTLRIAVIGCSTGAEAYSIASVLRARHPDLWFTVRAYDIDSACIKKATSGRYTPREVLQADLSGRATITADFARTTFDIEDGWYVVKSDVRKRVEFAVADALDPNLNARLGTSDIVYAQNVLLHLRPRDAKTAFRNICLLLNPKAALFVAGIDLPLLQDQTRKHGLAPLEYKIGEIYGEMRAYSDGWPWNYHAREPFMMVRDEWQRRYSTVFLKQ
jgi:chemotaxis methyl-accepting protein methylase